MPPTQSESSTISVSWTGNNKLAKYISARLKVKQGNLVPRAQVKGHLHGIFDGPWSRRKLFGEETSYQIEGSSGLNFRRSKQLLSLSLCPTSPLCGIHDHRPVVTLFSNLFYRVLKSLSCFSTLKEYLHRCIHNQGYLLRGAMVIIVSNSLKQAQSRTPTQPRMVTLTSNFWQHRLRYGRAQSIRSTSVYILTIP